MAPEAATRCAVCGARDWHAAERDLVHADGAVRVFAWQCGHCGLLCDAPGDAAIASCLERKLAASSFTCDPADPFGLDLYTLRTAATLFGRRATPANAAQREALLAPHGRLAAEAELRDLEPMLPAPLALGILCRMAELPALIERAIREARRFAHVVLLADGSPTELPAAPAGNVTLAARPLARDFAAQRNALQDRSPTPFMLQLDADESVPDELVAALGGLVEMAGESGALSVGFARRNHVEDVLSDVFPDIQYRLNRRDVRFRGAAHERPDFGAWQKSFIARSGAIDHHLSRAHVERRSQTYEAIAPGGGRLEERDALLVPFRP